MMDEFNDEDLLLALDAVGDLIDGMPEVATITHTTNSGDSTADVPQGTADSAEFAVPAKTFSSKRPRPDSPNHASTTDANERRVRQKTLNEAASHTALPSLLGADARPGTIDITQRYAKIAQERAAASQATSLKIEEAAKRKEPPKPKPVELSEKAAANTDAIEEFSGIKIKSRIVPAIELRTALLGRKVYRLKEIAKGNQKDFQPQSDKRNAAVDWVTIGVLAAKSAPKYCKDGVKKFGIWKLSDFNAEISVFLFGAAFDSMYLEPEGALYLVTSATMLPAKERAAFSLSVTEPSQLVKLGVCPVYGICKATKQDGQPCHNAIDTSISTYCVFHMGSEYKKLYSSVMRNELSNGVARKFVPAASDGTALARPVELTASGLDIGLGNAAYRRLQARVGPQNMHEDKRILDHLKKDISTGRYGAEAVSRMPGPAPTSVKPANQHSTSTTAAATANAPSLEKGFRLSENNLHVPAVKSATTTAPSQRGQASDPLKLSAAERDKLLNVVKRNSRDVAGRTAAPTAASSDYVSFGQRAATAALGGVVPAKPINDLHNFKEYMAARSHGIKAAHNSSVPVVDAPRTDDAHDSYALPDKLQRTTKAPTTARTSDPLGALFNDDNGDDGSDFELDIQTTPQTAEPKPAASIVTPAKIPGFVTPVPRSSLILKPSLLHSQQQVVERLVRTDQIKSAVRDRIATVRSSLGTKAKQALRQKMTIASKNSSTTPLAQLLGAGDIDLVSSEAAALLQQGSLHAADARAEADAALEEKMEKLEKLEFIEEKMREVTSKIVTRFFCVACEKWFDQMPQMCKEAKHEIVNKKKTRYYFACEHCHERSYGYEHLHVRPCRKCGHQKWKPCSIYKLKDYSKHISDDVEKFRAGEQVENSLRHGGMVAIGSV